MNKNNKEWKHITKTSINFNPTKNELRCNISDGMEENKHVIIKDYKNKFYKLLINLFIFIHEFIAKGISGECDWELRECDWALPMYKFMWLNYTEHGLYYKAQNIKIKLIHAPIPGRMYFVNVWAKVTPIQYSFYIIKENS